MSNCIDCGRPAEAHPVKYTSGGSCETFKTMDLPAGFTCQDCGHFHFCSLFIGPQIAGNTTCDWYPVRFIFRSPSTYETRPPA